MGTSGGVVYWAPDQTPVVVKNDDYVINYNCNYKIVMELSLSRPELVDK